MRLIKEFLPGGTTSRNWRALTADFLVKALAVSMLSLIPVTAMGISTASALTPSPTGGLVCEGDPTIQVTSTHGKAFYVDGKPLDSTTAINSAFIGYQVTNSGAPLPGVTVEISDFSESITSLTTGATDPQIVSVAGSLDVDNISSSSDPLGAETKTAFFLIEALNVFNWGNSSSATGLFYHTVKVKDQGGNVLQQCIYSFTQVFNVTKASANKVISTDPAVITPILGETFTITVHGDAGTIGTGDATPDKDIIWLNPAPYGSFPHESLTLEGTTFKSDTGSNCTDLVINQLLIEKAGTAPRDCGGPYTATYTFKMVNYGSATAKIVPDASIASGIEVKHTDLAGVGITLDLSEKVKTLAATDVTSSSAVLHGSADSAKGDLYYRLSTDSTTVDTSDSASATYASGFPYIWHNLNPNTTYYFQIYQILTGGLVGKGGILSFTTSQVTPPPPPAPPAPVTPPAVITWPTPSPVNYPTPLSGTQLNASATCNGQPVPGTYTYSPVLGTNLAPGTYTLNVTFVPNAASGCTSSQATVQFIVNAAPAKITWPTPDPELGPVTLSPTELNAVCSVPGKLTYDPAIGTVLQPGSYTLKVTCTPTDPNISPVSTTVTFIVKAPLTAPNAVTGPNTFSEGYVKWDAVPTATNYTVEIRGEQLCSTTSTSCTLMHAVGPKTPVIVTAFGPDNQKVSAKAVYFNEKLLPAIVVNFATGSSKIDAAGLKEVARVAAIIKLEGFTYVEITGHTDPRGGAINVKLSASRAKSLKAALLKWIPSLTFKDAGLASNDPKASNSTASGMAMNRRSEGAVR